jgi:hypothetical protein
MKVHELLGISGCTLVEPTFAELTEDFFMDPLLSMEADEGRLLLDEEETPLAIAFHNPNKGWYAATFLFRPITSAAIERFEEVGGDLWQDTRESWLSAVREYYSDELVACVPPAMEDLPPDRPEMIRDLIKQVWGERPGEICLDCCCGSGVGTAALRDCGMQALAYDNDPALLSLGLSRGRLRPGETMCIDAREASVYIDPVPLGLVLMAGEIYSHNADLWEQIIVDLMQIVDEALITVGKRDEAELVKEWCTEPGRSVEIFENERDPIYDRWCCIVR